MDLFVVNRYVDDNDEEHNVDRETINLQRLKQKIEERKKSYTDQKKTVEISIVPHVDTVKSAELDNKEDLAVDIPEQDKKQLKKLVERKPTAEFKVLGSNDYQKKVSVKRKLPHWLSNSIAVSTTLKNLKSNVENQKWLHPYLRATLLNEGVTHLFPVQEQVVPFILDEHKLPAPLLPQDICVSAPTGSGKTLSFVLPIIQILMNEIGHHIRALVVLPVQELATQVAKVFKKYAARTNLKVVLLSGSTPLRQEQKQIIRHTESLGWISEVDIIVCTAGRLVEHLHNTEGLSLKHLKFLVIDEADRIMDHIQNDWLYHLDKYMKLENELMTGKINIASWSTLNVQSKPPHKLLFSATLSQDPEKLEQWSLFQPKLFSAAARTNYEDEEQPKKYTTPDELDEQFIICDAEEKPLILYHLLVEKKWNRVLCFTNAAQSAHRLSVLLNTWGEGKIKAAELSSALNRATRESVLKKFQQSEIDVLIGTDALARGIDIPECDYVISYDPPRNVKTYVHRVGRTGRAGRTGCAVTILLQNQVNMFKDTLQMEGQNLPLVSLPDDIIEQLAVSYENAINATKNLIHEEITTRVKKSVALKRGPKLKPSKRKFDNNTSKSFEPGKKAKYE